jgi:hypothetical protein
MESKVKVQSYEYDGTAEGFHLMMERLYPGDFLWGFNATFLDENLMPCWRFTGIVLINNTGMIYRKGDHYQIDITE